jgi:hypothetical protein
MYPLSDTLILYFHRARLEETMGKARRTTGHRRRRAPRPRVHVRVPAVTPSWARSPEVV